MPIPSRKGFLLLLKFNRILMGYFFFIRKKPTNKFLNSIIIPNYFKGMYEKTDQSDHQKVREPQ